MSKSQISDASRATIAVDVMGSDLGVLPLIKGLSVSASKNSNLSFLIFGNEAEIKPALKKFSTLRAVSTVHHCDDVVEMDAKPAQVMRNGKGTSMYAAIDAVKQGDAEVAVSCGNTGALFLLSILILRKAPKINRPAIAVLWPSKNKQQFNIMLDGGADVRVEATDLHRYAVMGASFARNLFGLARPRIGILNVGTEEGKGRAELSEASELIEASKEQIEIDYVGFVEGSDIVGDRVDVIVTDGFTGNVALKTGEGVARYVRDIMTAAFKGSVLSRIGAFFAYPAIRAMRKKLDPRRANGGVFLGLGGTVIKSHGGSDAVAMAAAIKMASTLAEKGFSERMNERLRTALEKTGIAENE